MRKIASCGFAFLLACDGSPGSPGANGQPGEMGTVGDRGEPGVAGVPGTSCWDVNNDSMCNADEDTDQSGSCTANDCRGAAGPAGSPGRTLFKRTAFSSDEFGGNSTLTTLVFTSPVDGTAIFRSRGYCVLFSPRTGGEIRIASGATVADAGVAAEPESWAWFGPPQPPGRMSVTFNTERTASVLAGVQTSEVLLALNGLGSEAPLSCIGTLSVEIAQLLP